MSAFCQIFSDCLEAGCGRHAPFVRQASCRSSLPKVSRCKAERDPTGEKQNPDEQQHEDRRKRVDRARGIVCVVRRCSDSQQTNDRDKPANESSWLGRRISSRPGLKAISAKKNSPREKEPVSTDKAKNYSKDVIHEFHRQSQNSTDRSAAVRNCARDAPFGANSWMHASFDGRLPT